MNCQSLTAPKERKTVESLTSWGLVVHQAAKKAGSGAMSISA